MLTDVIMAIKILASGNTLRRKISFFSDFFVKNHVSSHV